MTITATVDKPGGYKTGDKMTLTVVSDKRVQSDTITVAAAGENITVTTTVTRPVTVTDSTGHTWAISTDDGKTAVYTATA